MNRDEAFEILKKYNKEEFHIRHALTVEGVMRYFARENNEDEQHWGIVGLLHDIDFELYPEEHCKKCVELLKENNVDNNMIKSICSHGYGICSDVEPTENMEKILCNKILIFLSLFRLDRLSVCLAVLQMRKIL